MIANGQRRAGPPAGRPPVERAERGAGGVELALAATAVLMATCLVVGHLRVAMVRADVEAAARAAARAASRQHGAGAATDAIDDIVHRFLAERGVECRRLHVERRGDLAAGSTVSVTVSCTVLLTDVALAGFPGSVTVVAVGVEPVDVIRGGRAGPAHTWAGDASGRRSSPTTRGTSRRQRWRAG